MFTPYVTNRVSMFHNPKYTTRLGNCETNAVIMNKKDWKRVKKESVYITAAQQLTINQEQDALKKQTKRQIKDHRTTLLEREQEKQALKKIQETQREMDEREVALAIAEAKANEELDEVKAMNAEMMMARVRTMRDRQIEQKRIDAQRQRERDAEEARMMEEGRQRALKIYADRAAALAEQRRRGGDVILAQIQEKKRNQQLEREKREREMQEMRRANELAREEDIRLLAEKKKRSQAFLEECMAANRVAIRRKQKEKQRDVEETEAIAEYQREKAMREEEYERKVAEQKAAKEREIAEVRKLQQRALDTREQEDELRARRIQEEQDRKVRARELAEAKRQQEIRENLRQDREKAIALKQRRLVELAKIEKAEFERVMAAQMEAREKDRQAYLRKLEENEKYRQELKDDMKKRRKEKQLEPLKHLDDRKHLEEQNQDYLDRLERIRQMKLDQLRSEGIPEKYLGDLQNMRFTLK